MLKSKFLKVLAFASALIITSSCFIFSSSAESVINPDGYTSGGLTFFSVGVDLIDSNGNVTSMSVNPYANNYAQGLFCWCEISGSNVVSGLWYDVRVLLTASADLSNPNYYVTGGYSCNFLDSEIEVLSCDSAFRWGGAGNDSPDQNASSITSFSKGGTSGYKFTYSDNQIGYNYRFYTSTVRVRPKVTKNSIGIYIRDINFQTITPSEKNTQSILNGGHDGPSYIAPDNTTVNDYHNLEGSINDSTSSARSDSISLFNNFGNLIQNSYLASSLVGVSKLFTDLFSISWLATLVQFSLVLGAFSFILGSATLIIGRISSNSARSEASRKNDSYRLARTEYFNSRSAYFNSRRKK